MVEVAVIVTLGTVLMLFAMTAVTRWIVPKVLFEGSHDEEHADEPRSPPA